MTEVFPISCLACRRLKVKCNKVKPCYQCTRRNIVCEFPSTYRNAVIYSEKTSENYSGHDGHRHHPDDSTTGETIESIQDELLSLRMLHSKILDENVKLRRKNKDLTETLSKQKNKSPPSREEDQEKTGSGSGSDSGPGSGSGSGSRSGSALGPDPGISKKISISGETSELGEKYYGPQSSNYMIDKLKTENDFKIPEAAGDVAGDDIQNTNDKVAELKNSTSEISSKEKVKSLTAAGVSMKNAKLIETSLSKKELPRLVRSSLDENHKVILKLVNLFFDQNTYYRSFISQQKIIDFLNDYKDIKDTEWERDDDLLLLYMVLLLLVQRLSPFQFEELGLLSGRKLSQFNKARSEISREVLYLHFERLRHNLINESTLTIQSYILCTEWYLIEQRYEESWSMMFHTCSIAYAIGLHAMKKIRIEDVGKLIGRNSVITKQQPNMMGKDVSTTGKSADLPATASNLTTTKGTTNNSYNQLDVQEEDVERFKVWFALKNISGQICSILGRPNPILIQVNASILRATVGVELTDIDISERISHIFLKIGLSECLRLSNMMLIENFMLEFKMEDLVNLNGKFDIEIRVLEWYLQDTSNEGLKIPHPADRANILSDLIVLYINRAKLFEPFINKFTTTLDAKVISNMLRFSIINFLEYVLMFIETFHQNFINLVIEEFNFADKGLKLGKLFRLFYPFLNSFVYQGIIVTFTFLHYGFKDFVNNSDIKADPLLVGETANHNEFLYLLEKKLTSLIHFGDGDQKISLWSSNTVKLVDKILEHIQTIYEKQRLRVERDKEIFEKELDEYHQIMSSTDQGYYGFNISDPFWLQNPDNFPYYLSSPSDDVSNSSKTLVDSASVGSLKEERDQKFLSVPAMQSNYKKQNSRQKLNRNKDSITLISPRRVLNLEDTNSISLGATTPSEGISSMTSDLRISNIDFNLGQSYLDDTNVTTPIQLTGTSRDQLRTGSSLNQMYNDYQFQPELPAFPPTNSTAPGQLFSYSPMMIDGSLQYGNFTTPQLNPQYPFLPLTSLPLQQHPPQQPSQHPPQQPPQQPSQHPPQQQQPQRQHFPQGFYPQTPFSGNPDSQNFPPNQFPQEYFQQPSQQPATQRANKEGGADYELSKDAHNTDFKRRRET